MLLRKLMVYEGNEMYRSQKTIRSKALKKIPEFIVHLKILEKKSLTCLIKK